VKLIETLADEVALHLLARFGLREVEIELRKFILPDTKFVSVRIVRTAS
jgi:phosphoglycolate phosphatase/dihydroneopterin aldolase